ncbi:Mom family adenine methylcarbamoylation protein [Micromonospora aurantiaca (nom. illeg.)]|uniref:Mom family adenine methylcarbamoylation protein n=1 Tax=Micromonospora aurantiaca (nom. illeg.) TaxID=47850 RepID=UPI00340E014F
MRDQIPPDQPAAPSTPFPRRPPAALPDLVIPVDQLTIPIPLADPTPAAAPAAAPRRARRRRPARQPMLEFDPSSLWCQRWTATRQQKWSLAAPEDRLRTDRYEVRPIDRSTAAAFVVPRHYSGSHVACRRRFGLYRAGALVGVSAYCVTSKEALRLAYPELEPGVESLECGRFVIAEDEPGNVESWFDARCRELLFAAGVQAVLSFADPCPRVAATGRVIFPGHVGYIYQAGGYLVAGRSERRTQWQLPDGTFLNGVTMQKIRRRRSGHEAAERRLVDQYGARPMRAGERPADWLRDAVRDDPTVGVSLIRHLGCLRYLKPLGTRKQAKQFKIELKPVTINRELRADWADLDDGAVLPFGPYPKVPDLARAAA